jgi:hypothetical protein
MPLETCDKAIFNSSTEVSDFSAISFKLLKAFSASLTPVTYLSPVILLLNYFCYSLDVILVGISFKLFLISSFIDFKFLSSGLNNFKSASKIIAF